MRIVKVGNNGRTNRTEVDTTSQSEIIATVSEMQVKVSEISDKHVDQLHALPAASVDVASGLHSEIERAERLNP